MLNKEYEFIEMKVCEYFNVCIDDLSSAKRKSDIAMARGFVFYILHRIYHVSASKLAIEYKRSVRAVFWHVDKISYLIKQRAYKEMYEQITHLMNCVPKPMGL